MPYRRTIYCNACTLSRSVLQVCLRRLVFMCTSVLRSLDLVRIVAACKAFQVAREAVRIRKQCATIAVTVVLYSCYHSRATLVKWLGSPMLSVRKQRPASRPHTEPFERTRYASVISTRNSANATHVFAHLALNAVVILK